ncbi:MAG: c-type cytochrome [Deltaproteobacteria bacterium]
MKAYVIITGLLLAGGVLSRAAAQAPDAKTLYQENCKKCHGVLGTPPKTMKAKFPKIATFDAEFIAKHSVDSIVKVLTKGKNDDMKSFKDKMSPDEIKSVAEYVAELAAKPHP